MAEMSEAAKKFLRELNKQRQNEARSSGRTKSDKEVAKELRKMAAQIERSKGSESAPSGGPRAKPGKVESLSGVQRSGGVQRPAGGRPMPGARGKQSPTVSKSTKKNVAARQARAARGAGQAVTGSKKAKDRPWLKSVKKEQPVYTRSNTTTAKTRNKNAFDAMAGKKKGN